MTRAPAILAVLLAAALQAHALSPWELYALSGDEDSGTAPQPFALWVSADVSLGIVTNWTSRVGGYAMTNYNGTIYAPTNSGDGIEYYKDGAGKAMFVSPALSAPTNSAFAFVFRRQSSGQRFVGFGATGSTAVQLPFVYLDSSLYSSPGFATQTKISTYGFPTGKHVLVVARNSTSVWARLDGAAFGTNAPASAPTVAHNVFGYLGPGTIANGSTNAFYVVAAYSNSASFTDAELDAIYTDLNTNY